MKRKIYSNLKKWKEESHGKVALMIDGARRVGKSWIAREFAQNEYKSFIILDFNNIQQEILYLFEHYLTDLDTFFARLSILTGVRLHKRESVIVFDEVQLYPKARAAIKYLVADGRYDYIETGSLVSINRNVKDIVIPSEERHINMFPMDLEEFMWAMGQDMLFDFARQSFIDKKPLGQTFHRRMMEMLRTYMIVGGMPQSILAFMEHKDFRDADAVKRDILTLYRNDISKYAGRSAPKVTRIFELIPGALQQHGMRFRPSLMKPQGRMREYAEAMFWLDESRVANFCYAATEPSVALALCVDEAKVKIYMADTGLLLSATFSPQALSQQQLYEKILRGKLEFNKGMLTENLVAQMLRAAGHDLYFYTSSSREDATSRMEIDFLIPKSTLTARHNIYPIEVKSANHYSYSSLTKFIQKFPNYLATPYILHPGDIEKRDDIVCLPLYMTCFL